MKTKRYKSPEAASAVFWGISEEELMEGNITNFDEDGELSEFPAEQVMEGIRKVGVWGFVDPECCIHFWCTDDIDMKDLIGFFAHEIGHRTGRPIYDPKDSLVKPDDVTEEMLKDLKEEDMVDELDERFVSKLRTLRGQLPKISQKKRRKLGQLGIGTLRQNATVEDLVDALLVAANS